jgi:hypothetical protein
MSTNKKAQTNGVNQLSEQQEAMRMEVVDLELKARYWEAQWKIKFYTLEGSKLQEEYDRFIQDAQQKEAEARQKYEEFIKEIQEKAEKGEVEVSEPLPESLDQLSEVQAQLEPQTVDQLQAAIDEQNTEGRV